MCQQKIQQPESELKVSAGAALGMSGVVVCLGEACLEYIAHTDGYPKRAHKT